MLSCPASIRSTADDGRSMGINRMMRTAALAITALTLAMPAVAQQPSGMDVMKRSEDIQEKAIDRQATMKMTLVNKRGSKRE